MNKNFFIFLSIALSLVLVVVWGVNFSNQNNDKSESVNTPSTLNSSDLKVIEKEDKFDRIKAFAIQSNKFYLPDPLSQAKSEVKLPVNLEQFILPEAQTVETVKAVYPNQVQGYLLTMKNVAIPLQSIVNIYSNLGKQNNWETKFAAYADKFGLVTLYSEQFQVQIEATELEDHSTVIVKISII